MNAKDEEAVREHWAHCRSAILAIRSTSACEDLGKRRGQGRQAFASNQQYNGLKVARARPPLFSVSPPLGDEIVHHCVQNLNVTPRHTITDDYFCVDLLATM